MPGISLTASTHQALLHALSFSTLFPLLFLLHHVSPALVVAASVPAAAAAAAAALVAANYTAAGRDGGAQGTRLCAHQLSHADDLRSLPKAALAHDQTAACVGVQA